MSSRGSIKHVPRPPARRPAYAVTRGERKREARVAVKEYWNTYTNMRGMATLNKKKSPHRRDMLPMPDPPDPNVTKPRAPAFSMQGRTTVNNFEDANPGPGAYAPKLRQPSAGPRWTTPNTVRVNPPDNPGPGAYSPRLPGGRAPLIGPRLQDPTEAVVQNLITKRSPGPADYHVPGTFGKQGGGFSFGVRTVQKMAAQDTPGPGSYEVPSTLAGLKFSIGGHSTDPSRLEVEAGPGPGTYDVKGDIEANMNTGRGPAIKGREMLDNRRYPD
eukprot:TRINITY_DN66656_c2_g1_i2.p1 TRINITY_DN66656_c2_g1~~TRINITY_DN66656_c2_g1_i2.p1  ORF type:complete len:272 (-),score=11.17 TRINITY_DN66656_c2_g1_i2:612-1427(-)